MPEYQYIQVGLRPEHIDAIDEKDVPRSEWVRELVERELA